VAQIFLKVRELYKKTAGKFPRSHSDLRTTASRRVVPAEVLKEVNAKRCGGS